MTKTYIAILLSITLTIFISYNYGLYTAKKEIAIAKAEQERELFWNDINNDIVVSCIDCPFTFGVIN